MRIRLHFLLRGDRAAGRGLDVAQVGVHRASIHSLVSCGEVNEAQAAAIASPMSRAAPAAAYRRPKARRTSKCRSSLKVRATAVAAVSIGPAVVWAVPVLFRAPPPSSALGGGGGANEQRGKLLLLAVAAATTVGQRAATAHRTEVVALGTTSETQSRSAEAISAVAWPYLVGWVDGKQQHGERTANERTNERTNERPSERTNERTNERRTVD